MKIMDVHSIFLFPQLIFQVNQGHKPQGKPWTQISSCSVAKALAQATWDGVLYPPLSVPPLAGFDLLPIAIGINALRF